MNQIVDFSLACVLPLSDRLLLRRLPPLADSGLLVLPDVATERSHRGEVLRCGPGKYMNDGGWVRPIVIKPGQVVQYQSFDMDDGTHVLIQEADVLFVESDD